MSDLLDYRIPWRLTVDPEENPDFEEGVRHCKLNAAGRYDTIASGWDYPHIFRLMSAAPDLLEALQILVGCAEKLPGIHSLAIDNARAAIAKATAVQS